MWYNKTIHVSVAKHQDSKVDAELSKELEQWNEMLRNDVVKLCQEDNFNTGEDRAYTGEDIIYFRFCKYGEARSVYTLQHLGITQVLCLCSNEIGQSDSQSPELFKNRNFSELNIIGGMECLKESTSSSPTK